MMSELVFIYMFVKKTNGNTKSLILTAVNWIQVIDEYENFYQPLKIFHQSEMKTMQSIIDNTQYPSKMSSKVLYATENSFSI